MDAAFFAAISLRFLGETSLTAPFNFGTALPSFGRVAADRCFLPNRFFCFFGAIKTSVSSIIKLITQSFCAFALQSSSYEDT